MNSEIKNAIEKYQCAGCAQGFDITCYESSNNDHNNNKACGNHHPGTGILYFGKINQGLPNGFNRLGQQDNMHIRIYKVKQDYVFDKFNLPVWKHLTSEGHTIVRGLRPRLNEGFIYIFLENCIDKIDCLEITQRDIDEMD